MTNTADVATYIEAVDAYKLAVETLNALNAQLTAYAITHHNGDEEAARPAMSTLWATRIAVTEAERAQARAEMSRYHRTHPQPTWQEIRAARAHLLAEAHAANEGERLLNP